MPHPWAVHDAQAGTLVGFAMISDNIPPPIDDGLVGPYYLWKLLIDHRCQRQGYGAATLDAVVSYLRTRSGAGNPKGSRAPLTCERERMGPCPPTALPPPAQLAKIDDGAHRRGWRHPLREDVRQALAIDASSTIEDRTIDITTTGRRSGQPRRIEIAFYRLGDDIYLSGVPGPKTREWLANLAAQPRFTFHLKNGVIADLPATATVIVDPAERRRVLAVFVEEFNRRHGPDSPWPEAVLDEWVEHSPLAKVTFLDTD